MINILVVINRHINGCVYYRQYEPHVELHQKYQNEFHVMFTDFPSGMTDDELKKYDIMHCHKGYISFESVIERIKKLGIKVIIDFDDYWNVPKSHSLYNQYHFERDKDQKFIIKDGAMVRRKESAPDEMRRRLREFDYVTASTPILADLIRPINKNVVVFRNGINPDTPMWERIETSDGTVRFGWVGGSQHWIDIQLLRGVPNKLFYDKDTKGKYKLFLFGYVAGTVHQNFADIFTDYGRIKEPVTLFPPRTVLHQEGSPSYAQFYNIFDVALVPLADTKFNASKSELKVIEAGFHKKAAIVSDVYPYKYVCTKDNCLLARKQKDWFRHMKFLIKNPNAAKDYGEKLYESVQPYDIRNITPLRAEFYKSILFK